MPPKDAAGRGASSGGGAGRLNGLPDQILVQVLRHLKPWEAMRTCLLSRRWRHLPDAAIAATTRLDIRQPCCCRRGDGGEDDQVRAEAFAAFVKHLLLRRRRTPHVKLEALRLCWSHPANDGDADLWIAHAVRNGVEKVELSGAHHAQLPFPDYLSFVPGDKTDYMRLKTVRLIQVRLDDTIIRKFCSCLEELDLKDCSVDGKEIDSKQLKRLSMVGCKFVDGFTVKSPKLVSLTCIRPFGYVPRFQDMAALITAAITLDDPCLRSDCQWPQKEDQQDESDDEFEFFGHDDSEDSDVNSFAHADADESGDNIHNDSDDNSVYYDSDRSEPSDEEEDDTFICYREIAHEQNKRYKYWINGSKHIAGDPRDECSKNSISGGNGLLCSLSNVKTMDLFAHPEEMVLMRELKCCPNFINLKTLSLGEWCMTPHLDALAKILKHSTNLENLFLHLDLAFKSRVGIDPQGGSFSCTNLKRVRITCCNRDIMVHRLASFFNKNGIAYEKIFVRRTASSTSGSAKGHAVSIAKRKAESEAEKRDAKQRKPGNRGRT